MKLFAFFFSFLTLFWNDFFALKVNCFILFIPATLRLNCNLFFPCIFLNFHLVQLMLFSRFKQFKFTNFVLHHVFHSLNPNNYQIVWRDMLKHSNDTKKIVLKNFDSFLQWNFLISAKILMRKILPEKPAEILFVSIWASTKSWILALLICFFCPFLLPKFLRSIFNILLVLDWLW